MSPSPGGATPSIPSKSFLDFYTSRSLVPGVQATSLERLFHARRGLYAHLGLVPRFLRGLDILELGPGSGDYAVYTASLGPARLTFVEGSPECVEALEEKRREGAFGDVPVEIHREDILEFRGDREYDLVLCEGTIPGQDDPASFTRQVARHVAPGGVLVVTNATRHSLLADVCRRVVLPIFRDRHGDGEELVDALVDHFTPDLEALGNCSRSVRNWVLDIIVHPWHDIQFSIAECLEILGDSFEILGSSPRWISDWTWYKAIDGEFSGINERALREYRSQELCLIDQREAPRAVPREVTGEFLDICDRLYREHDRITQSDGPPSFDSFRELLGELESRVREVLPQTAASLRDYRRGLRALLEGETPPDFGTFRAFWGRGQQYSSYLRIRPEGDRRDG